MEIFGADYAGHNTKTKSDAERAERLDQLAAHATIDTLAALEATLGASEVGRLAADRGMTRHELARRVVRDGMPLSLGGQR